MAPMVSATNAGITDQTRLLSEVKGIQKSLFEQASNYAKLVLGLAYAGLLAIWAGTKNNLRPWELVSSALLICLSLLVYVVFEVFQVRLLSTSAVDLARTLNTPGLEFDAFENYKKRTMLAYERYFKVWNIVFIFCVTTGIVGALILVAAFIHSLWRMI